MAMWALKIGGVEVARSEPGGDGSQRPSLVEPVSLERSYDGPAVLTMFVRGDARRRTYSADATVILTRDDDVVFTGLLQLPRATAQTGDPGGTEYQAVDRSTLAANRRAVDSNGATKWQSGYGELSAVANGFLAKMAGALGPVGVEVSARFINCGGIPIYPLAFDGVSIDAGLRQIAAAAPGVRLLMGPGDSQYVFVGAYRSPELLINASSEILGAVDIIQSLEGCCGAVKTNSRNETLSYALAGIADLQPAWDSSLQSQWSLVNAMSMNTDGSEGGLSSVFRVFRIVPPMLLPPPRDGDEMWVEQRAPDGTLPPWNRRDISRIDLAAGLVETRDPIIGYIKPTKAGRRNAMIPGQSLPGIARLRYVQRGSGEHTVEGSRYPLSGYQGRAVQLAPISMAFEKLIEVPALPQGSFNHALYARAAWEVLSEPVTQGTVTIAGDPPAGIFGLDRRISLAATSGAPTGYESMRAPLNGIRIEFAGGMRTTLSFNTQRSVLLAGGAA